MTNKAHKEHCDHRPIKSENIRKTEGDARVLFDRVLEERTRDQLARREIIYCDISDKTLIKQMMDIQI